jgi:biotin operon repressor
MQVLKQHGVSVEAKKSDGRALRKAHRFSELRQVDQSYLEKRLTQMCLVQ